jgi:transposase
LLVERGLTVSTRTIERAVADIRRADRVAQLATVRVETPPGDQLQIDFGQKPVRIGGTVVRVFLLVAVLSYSRRLFVKAFLSERQDDWREGITAAFMHFDGVPWLSAATARPVRRCFIRPTWPSVAIGRCSRAPVRRTEHAPKGKRKPA